MAEARHGLKMREIDLIAQREAASLKMSALRQSEQARLAEAEKFSNAEMQSQLKANAEEIAALVKSDKDYEGKLKGLQNRRAELAQAGENQVTSIRVKAEEDRNRRILSAEQRRDDAVAKGLTSTLMRHQSFTKTMIQLGDQVAAGMMETAMKSVLANDYTKISDAKFAARKGWIAGTHFPWPSNLVMEPLLAAAAFTAVMAFEKGGIVPGSGGGDSVPAMLTPGEAVLPKALTEGLMRSGGNGGGNVTHMHAHFAPQIHAVDAEGVDRMLRTHAASFHRHFDSHVRRMNK